MCDGISMDRCAPTLKSERGSGGRVGPALLAVQWSLLSMLHGCATAPRTTVLQAGDLDATTTAMAAKLADSRFLAERTPESPKMTIAVSKVENLSSDIITESEEWSLMQRVRDSLPIMQLGAQKNLVFVIPAEHMRAGQSRGAFSGDFAG